MNSKVQHADPQPTVDRIEELARRVLQGDILLPKFQREFVWDPKKIRMLLDSVSRGYPIGSLLLWRTRQELKSERSVAGLDVATRHPDYPYNYLLDGQQRLSTMCGALYWNGNDPKSKWNLAYDLRTEEFIHPGTLDDLPLHQVRTNRLSDPPAFYRQITQLEALTAPDKLVLKDRADELFRRFKDYKIATVTLGDMSVEEVAPIFERINSQGTQLTKVELMRAVMWSQEFDLFDEIDGIRSDLNEKGFQQIDRKTIMRSLSASLGGGFSIDEVDHLRKYTAPELIAASKQTRECYKRAVDFLASELGISGSGALPYANGLVVIVEMFRTAPTPSAAQFAALKSWFWRSAISGHFGGWNTGQMAKDLQAIRAFAQGKESIIHVDALRPEPAVWSDRAFRSNNALARVFALLLAQTAPRDLLTGQAIDVATALSSVNQKEYHHVFPRKYLTAAGVLGDRINSMANIVYLTSASNKAIAASRPSEYLRKAERELGAQFAPVLESNLISAEALDAALRDDYDGFLAARARTIDVLASKNAAWSSATPVVPAAAIPDLAEPEYVPGQVAFPFEPN